MKHQEFIIIKKIKISFSEDFYNFTIVEVPITYRMRLYGISGIHILRTILIFLIISFELILIKFNLFNKIFTSVDSFITNITIEKIKDKALSEKALWKSDQIINSEKAEELIYNLTKKTFLSVKIALNNPSYKEILSKKIRYIDLDNDEIYNLIKSLPKVDLHCHLGGCARKKDLAEIAFTYHQENSLLKTIDDFFKNSNKENIKTLFRENPKTIVKVIFSFNNNKNIKPKYDTSRRFGTSFIGCIFI